ncbi:hypothetical protein HF086_018330 [Spodoptera exigua]|uniref:Uncharacterized protein n=1 Tax=Spodoptera exigua TaxID=7107 RepID=A0A922S8C8_SPOEX|nr:hypothetical protein HF086_018330 [Spodoptera exigua]
MMNQNGQANSASQAVSGSLPSTSGQISPYEISQSSLSSMVRSGSQDTTRSSPPGSIMGILVQSELEDNELQMGEVMEYIPKLMRTGARLSGVLLDMSLPNRKRAIRSSSSEIYSITVLFYFPVPFIRQDRHRTPQLQEPAETEPAGRVHACEDQDQSATSRKILRRRRTHLEPGIFARSCGQGSKDIEPFDPKKDVFVRIHIPMAVIHSGLSALAFSRFLNEDPLERYGECSRMLVYTLESEPRVTSITLGD